MLARRLLYVILIDRQLDPIVLPGLLHGSRQFLCFA